MIKAINKSLSLSIITCIAIGHIGCSTPGTTDTGKKPDGTQATVKVIAKQNSLLLTQKSASGEINPIVPEDLESITINGKVIKAADIKIEKKGFATKAVDYFLKFVNGKFVIEGTDGDIKLHISFKLKDSPTNVVLPDFALMALTGDLRVEFAKNDKGEITGVNGGFNNNGILDTSKPMFRFDPVTGKLDVIANGQISTFILELADVKTELKIKTEPVKTDLTPEKLKEEQEKTEVDAPSPAAPFVGKWKFSTVGILIGLNLREGTGKTLNYSANIVNSLINFNGDFSGNVNYSSTAVNILNIESAANGKKITGKIELTGDNSLNFTLGSTEVSELKNFVGQSLGLSRDVN